MSYLEGPYERRHRRLYLLGWLAVIGFFAAILALLAGVALLALLVVEEVF